MVFRVAFFLWVAVTEGLQTVCCLGGQAGGSAAAAPTGPESALFSLQQHWAGVTWQQGALGEQHELGPVQIL